MCLSLVKASGSKRKEKLSNKIIIFFDNSKMKKILPIILILAGCSTVRESKSLEKSVPSKKPILKEAKINITEENPGKSSSTTKEESTSSIPGLIDFTDRKETDVYSSPLDSSSIGSIITFQSEERITTYFKNKDGVKEFTPDFFQGHCDFSNKNVSLQNIFEIKNGFSSIGTGPWGKEGWVKDRHYSINSEYLPIGFSYKEWKAVEFGPQVDNKIVASLLQEIEGEKVSSQQIFSFDELRNPKTGKINFSPNCTNVNRTYRPYSVPEEVKKIEPYFVDLLPSEFQSGEFSGLCNLDSKEIDPDKCEISESSCNFEGQFSDNRIVQLMRTTFPVSYLYLELPWISEPIQSNSSLTYYNFHGVGNISEATVYSVAIIQKKYLKMEGPLIYPENEIQIANHNVNFTKGPPTISKPLKYRKTYFKVYADDKKELVNSKILLGGVLLNSGKNLVLMSPGNYKVTLKDVDGIAGKYKTSFKIEDSDIDQPVEVPFYISKFVRTEPKNNIELSTDNTLILDTKGSDAHISKYTGILHSSQGSIDITNEMSLFSNRFNLSRDINEDKKHGPLRINIQGTCQTIKKKELYKDIPLYDTSNKYKQLGFVRARLEDDKRVNYYFISNVIEEPFELNYANFYCEAKGKMIGTHQVFKTAPGMANLGSGPWGDDGWIEAYPYTLSASDFSFNYLGLTDGFFSIKDDGTFDFTGNRSTEDGQNEDGESIYSNTRETINLNLIDITDQTGQFRLAPSCDLGC